MVTGKTEPLNLLPFRTFVLLQSSRGRGKGAGAGAGAPCASYDVSAAWLIWNGGSALRISLRNLLSFVPVATVGPMIVWLVAGLSPTSVVLVNAKRPRRQLARGHLAHLAAVRTATKVLNTWLDLAPSVPCPELVELLEPAVAKTLLTHLYVNKTSVTALLRGNSTSVRIGVLIRPASLNGFVGETLNRSMLSLRTVSFTVVLKGSSRLCVASGSPFTLFRVRWWPVTSVLACTA